MPTELNRIKELAGLQQEAAVVLTAQQKQGLDAINAKYGKYIGYGNGGSLPVEAMERAIDPGSTLWADDKEENELKAYMKKMGYKDLSDMESKDEEYVDNVRLPISDAMADDLQKVLGDYNDNSGLAQAAKDYLGSLGETAVAEAPAGLTAPQKQGLAALVKKYAKRKTYGGGGLIDGYLDYLAQTGVWTDAADEKEFDVALKKLGHDDLDAWEQDAEGEELEQFLELSPITAQAQNDVEKVLGKGFYNNTNLINAASDYVKSLPETAVQPTPVLNAVKETPAISQVDEAIKKATAQLKSFSNFDGLKPYKPKKK